LWLVAEVELVQVAVVVVVFARYLNLSLQELDTQ
jgi:hypothetical protein